MPVRHRELGDELAPPEPKRCRHCDESRSSCGGGSGSEGSEERASWRVTLDHDLVETLSAIYPEWFKPQHRRERSRAATPTSPASPPRTPASSSDDTFSSGAEEMAGRQASGSGASEPPSSPRVSPPKVVVDDSPLQPAMGKHKESLKVKLMMRRPITQLVAQGIMPPLKTPAAYFEQCKQLERAKTGDLLKAKIQRRPDRQELERRHILEQESHVDPSLAEKQRMLKKARLADQLNDQLSHRPGPLELIKKNILHTEENIETAVKSGILAFKATSEGASGRPQHPSSYCGPPDEVSPSPSPPSTLSPVSVASSPQHPAPGKDKNRKKNKQKQQPKARFKFHEYKGPPNAQKSSSPPGSVETPYELLLQQQQLLLQLMPASPAASITSDSSDAYTVPPPPPPPPAPIAPIMPIARFEDMKVSDLRAECKRRNLPVSGPKLQLILRLRPYLEKQEDPPRSPASVTSIASIASVTSPDIKIESDSSEDIVQSQRRQIEDLERKLEASRQQMEAVRREAAGAAASDQSRRLLQAHIYMSQLRAQRDALQQPQVPAPTPSRYVIAASSDATPDRLVSLFTVASSPAAAGDGSTDAVPQKTANPAYILTNGVKVVPIAILPTTHYEPERTVSVPPPPPPPPPPPLPQVSMNTPIHDCTEDSQIMDDVLEILVENGELPASAVDDATTPRQVDSGYITGPDTFSPTDVLTNDVLDDTHVRDSLAAEELQRELDDIQNEILCHADLHAINNISHCDMVPTAADIEPDLSVELLSNSDFHTGFGVTDSSVSDHDFLGSLLSGESNDRTEDKSHMAMDIGEEPSERMSMTPLTNGDILDYSRTSFEYMDDLSLPSFHNEDSRNGMFEERSCEFDLKELEESRSNMNVDGDGYEYMSTELIPNLFGRGPVAQCDPLLGGLAARPPPRPQHKHYSWDRIEYDAT
ncbi:myocardin-related transcription factor B isoform X2 [Achroia grisella]|uniref:myocardin-related transcription factor B isoform X2 n=1 Tax=Achroia grisella TaxID=688607 RepID=UPI0027D27D87|nr:myocardin-related transcription factor B isoform X2 [Achroia grisella]